MLTIAAILMAGFTACSADDATENIEQPTEPYKIHVTVGAGLGDDETRSEVVLSKNSETGKTTRTLNFTEGDRLYIGGKFDDEHYMVGYLNLSSGAGTTSATFSGDLTVYKKVEKTMILGGVSRTFNDIEVDQDYALQNPDNPMLEYGDNTVFGVLFPYNGLDKLFNNTLNGLGLNITKNYQNCLVTGESDNVKKLMETAIHVSGTYDKDDGSFKLACGEPIFNCNFTVEGLSANTEYYVRIVKDSESTGYEQAVTSDANGYVLFACTTNLSGEGNWQVQLCTDADFNSSIFVRPIGTKNLGAKVYNVGNVGNAPTPDPGDDPGNNPDPGDDPNPATDVISLSAVTSEFIGNVIGTDGQVYPPGYTMPDGVGKAAMICNVSERGHGIAIELNSNPPAKRTNTSPGVPSDIPGGSWTLPSCNDWNNMLRLNESGFQSGEYDIFKVSTFVNRYNATGFTFNVTTYWTSDTYRGNDDFQYAYCICFIHEGSYDIEFASRVISIYVMSSSPVSFLYAFKF